MKEIKILIQQLRNYPNNFFVYSNPLGCVGLPETLAGEHTKVGLIVCDMDGIQQGFIETGGKEGVIIE